MTAPHLADLPCVPESRLADDVPARLPAATPPPPWDCLVRAVVWLQRTPPPPLTDVPAPLTGVTVGAFVEYLESPVGPYREVFAGPVVRGTGLPALHVPFIAVDSVPSVHGGRTHWGLPKTLAAFTGDVGAGRATAEGDGWSVQVDAAGAGLPVPLAAAFAGLQQAGRARVAVRGRGRLTRVRVTATGPTLTSWLGDGTHVGVVGRGRLLVHPPLRTRSASDFLPRSNIIQPG